jgi:hypothetical protein
MTRPFEKQFTSNGKNYNTLRIGEQVPDGCVNLAYVFNRDLNPKENIQIIDSGTADNMATLGELEAIMWSDQNGYIYRGVEIGEDMIEFGSPDIFTRDFALTSRFEAGEEANISNAYFYRYILKYKHVDVPKLDTISNVSPAISIALENGDPIPSGCRYQILLTKDQELYKRNTGGQYVPLQKWSYTVTLYTNFTSDIDNTYVVRYNKGIIANVDGHYVFAGQGSNGLEKGYSETINGMAVMMENGINQLVAGTPYEDADNTYAVEEAQGGYKVKVNNNGYKGTPDTRVRQYFWWRISWGGIDTDWFCDYVINELQGSTKRVYPISTGANSLVTLMQKYDPSFVAVGSPTLFVGTASGTDEFGAPQIVSIVSGDPVAETISFNDVRLTVNNAVWDLRAYTVNPDNSQFNVVLPAKRIGVPVSGNVSLSAHVWETTRTFTVGATAFASSPTMPPAHPTGDNLWVMFRHDNGGPDTNYTLPGTTTEFINRDHDQADESPRPYITGYSYFWIPMTLTVTQGIRHDHECWIKINGNTVYSNYGISNSWTRTDITFSPGWNKVEFWCRNKRKVLSDAFNENDWRFIMEYPFITLINEAIQNSTKTNKVAYMHSTNPGSISWQTQVTGVFTARLNDGGQPIDMNGTLSSTALNEPDTCCEPVFINEAPVAYPADGIALQGWTLSPNNQLLSFTYRMTSGAFWRPFGSAPSINVSLGAAYNEESPNVIIKLDTLTSSLPLPTDPLSSAYKNLYFFIKPSDPHILLRLVDTTNNELFGGSLLPSGSPNNTVDCITAKLDDLDTLGNFTILAWTNSSSIVSTIPLAMHLNQSRSFYLEAPEKTALDNWYMNVHNSRMAKTFTMPPALLPGGEHNPIYDTLIASYPGLANHIGSTVNVEYSLAEFDRQPFVLNGQTRIPPVIEVENETSVVIDQYTIRVSRTPLCHYQPITIDGDTNNVRDIQAAQGIIKLKNPIIRGHAPLVTYRYLEDWVSYNGFYDNVDFWHLDLNPSPHHDMVTTELGVPGHESRNETYSSKARTRAATNTILSRPLDIYLYPRSVSVSGIKITNFLGQDISENTIFHTTIVSEGIDPLANNILAIKLGRIYVQPNSSLHDIIIMDTRTRGGGLNDNISQAIIDQINPEANYYWDIGYWDGQPYQENGVVYIRLPDSLLKQNGGRFSEEEVRNIVKKNLALGVLPEIEFVHYPAKSGISNNITGEITATPDATSITFDWAFHFRNEDIFIAPYLIGYIVRIIASDNSFYEEVFIERTEDQNQIDTDGTHTTNDCVVGITYTCEVRPLFSEFLDNELKLTASAQVEEPPVDDYTLVAASDSSQSDKDSAAYVCNGVNDGNFINTILDTNNKVRFLAGTYIIQNYITVDGVEIIGVGDASLFYAPVTGCNGGCIFSVPSGIISGIKIDATNVAGSYSNDIGISVPQQSGSVSITDVTLDGHIMVWLSNANSTIDIDTCRLLNQGQVIADMVLDE